MFKSGMWLTRHCKKALNCPRTFHSSVPLKEKWDLLTAVLVERKPIICRELLDIEKDFKEYLKAVEFERSLKNDTEISLEKEKKDMAQRKESDDIDLKAKETTQDFIDACKEELARFKPAEKIVETADETSPQRKLDRPLVLVVNQKIGEETFHLLPQGKREEGETLRQTADRVLQKQQIKARIFGNAPCGFYKYKYPKGSGKDSVGAKVFIYFARYSSGKVENGKWLDKGELDRILPENYKRSVLPILFD